MVQLSIEEIPRSGERLFSLYIGRVEEDGLVVYQTLRHRRREVCQGDIESWAHGHSELIPVGVLAEVLEEGELAEQESVVEEEGIVETARGAVEEVVAKKVPKKTKKKTAKRKARLGDPGIVSKK